MEKIMLDVKDIMALTGIGRDKAYVLLYSKQFPVKLIGRRMLVHRDIFDEWLKGKEYRIRDKK